MKAIYLLVTIVVSVSALTNLPQLVPEISSNHVHFGMFSSYLTMASSRPAREIAQNFVNSQIQLANGFGFVIKDHYKTDHNGVTHIYFKQTFNGIEIINGDFNVNIDKYGRVFSYGSSFFSGETLDALTFQNLQSANEISPAEAVISFAKYAGLSSLLGHATLAVSVATDAAELAYFSDIKQPIFRVDNVSFTTENSALLTRKYLIISQPYYKLVPVWDALFQMTDGNDFFNAGIHSETGQILRLINWLKHSHYVIYPIGVNDPEDGDRKVISHPENKLASPLGWHDQGIAGKGTFRTTIGNNVYVQANPAGGDSYKNKYRPTGSGSGSNLTFDFAIDLSKEPETYVNASIVNLFFWNNILHDIFYNYGFDEKSGNFQENNFGRGGLGNDAVLAFAQDGSEMNDAAFVITPDGVKPRMYIHLFNQTHPKRDAGLEAGIIIHEYGHGVSGRIAGGASNCGCLSLPEASGLGEGFGDLWSIMLRMRKEYTGDMEFVIGAYSFGGKRIRPYLYSRSLERNPQTYGYIRKPRYDEAHFKGAVWVSIMYEVYWQLVDAFGFNPDWYAIRKKDANAGNLILLQLTIDALKLLPCQLVSFVDARNTIFEADVINYDGKHFCVLWKGFAKRGLGVYAKSGGFEDFTVPTECQ